MKFKPADKVKITAGKDKGKQGTIKLVLPKLNRVVVEGINLYHKHLKPRQTGNKGQIVDRERPLPLSNIALICPKCHQVTRVGYVIDASGHKLRTCRKCHAPLTEPKTK